MRFRHIQTKSGDIRNSQSQGGSIMRIRRISLIIVASLVVALLALASVFSVFTVWAGDPDSPAGPTDPAGQMYTLEQIYDRLSGNGNATKMTSFTEPSSGPPTGTMHTLDEIYELAWPARVPKTGQTKCYDTSGTEISCTGTGQDGEYQKGVTWPSPRFTGNGTGVITDTLTRLMWAENANLDGTKTWNNAIDYCNGLSLGGYTDWRLPNVRELFSLIDVSQYIPALPSGHPFDKVQSYYYWSSTTYASYTSYAWYVDLYYGDVDSVDKANTYYVWPVRGGQ
jgi:hypothetical protein